MNIKDEHLYQGAALTQIAEHPQFTAINAFKVKTGISRSSFIVNNNIAVYLKYATSPKKPYDEYIFTFGKKHLAELDKLAKKYEGVFVGMVCVEDREICALSLEQLMTLINRRRAAKKILEEQYTVCATLPKGGKFRVYVTPPGQRKTILGNQLLVARKAFPECLFS